MNNVKLATTIGLACLDILPENGRVAAGRHVDPFEPNVPRLAPV